LQDEHRVMDLTIVVPTFREAPGIQAFLADLTGSLRRLGRSFEVIVVDDSSPDGTADLAARSLSDVAGRLDGASRLTLADG
jgi:glycosyltransferase involved in cell wall biosynthesis